MNSDKIYPSMVIRSQEEVIKLLEEENKKLYKRIKELEDGFKASNKELSMVYDELEQKNKIIEEIKEDLRNLRNVAFTKEFGNEWNSCLSFNEDILPIINKMQELEKGSEE